MKKDYIEKIRENLFTGGKDLEMFEEVLNHIEKYVNLSKKVLDIASDKDPVFSSLMARVFPDNRFTHFRDNEKLLPRIHKKYSKIPNLEIIYSAKDLTPPYDLAIAFLTLHELAEPGKSLRETYDRIRKKGKLIVIDYDLTWFNKIAEKEGWDIKTKWNNFAEHIFTVKNERKVLREEEHCVKNHSRWGIENYIANCREAGFKELDSKPHLINTPWGKKPKIFSSIWEKPN